MRRRILPVLARPSNRSGESPTEWNRIWLLAAFLLVAGGCAPKTDDPEDIAAIKADVTAYGQEATTGNAAAIADFYTADAVRLEPNAPLRVGREAMQSVWQNWFDLYQHEETDVAEDVHVVGDLAYARGTFATKDTPKVPGAAVIDDKGKWLSLYHRQADGSWKSFADMWSSDLPVVQVLAPTSADELALLQIERDWAAAWLHQDATALGRILADGFVENWRGQVSTKAQVLANIRAGSFKVDSCENSDMRVLVFGDHAVVNGLNRSKQTQRGKDAGGTDRRMDTFVRQDGQWRAVYSHLIKTE